MNKLNTWWKERIAVPDTDVSRESLFEIFSKAFKFDNKQVNIKQQINESMKELLKEDISNLSDEQQTKLIKDTSSILINIIKLHEFTSTELRDSKLTNKVAKVKTYMQDFTDYLTAHRVGETGSDMDIDQEEQKANLEPSNPRDKGMIEAKESDKAKRRLNEGEWRVSFNLKNAWKNLEQETEQSDFNNQSEVFKNFINQLKQNAVLVGKKLGQQEQMHFEDLVGYLEGAEDAGEFDSLWSDLYDWADYNKVWMGII